MRRKANIETANKPTEKRRPGRKPMSAEEKEAAAKLRAVRPLILKDQFRF